MNLARQRIRLVVALCLTASICSVGLAQSEASRLAALQKRVQVIETDTAQVEAITKIQRLGRAFGYYTDKGFFGEAADLFTEGGTFQWGNDGIYKGRDHIRELLTRHGGGSLNEAPGLPFGRLNLRMQLQPLVTVAADGMTASARWREWGLLGQYRKAAFWGDAVIEDRYIKEGGVWKIAARQYFLNFEAPYPGGWAALKPGTPGWGDDVAKAFPPDAPVAKNYPQFPAIFVPPYHYADGNLRSIQSRPPVNSPKRPDDALGQLERLADAKELALGRAHSVRAIENLQAMYGYYIDKGQWKSAAALFNKGASYEFGQGGVYVGNASIERGLSLMGPAGLEAGQLNNYVMVQPIIHVASDNRTAKARWRSDVQRSRAGKGIWGGGVYENEYVNDGGTWKFSKLHYHVTFWGDYDAGLAAKPIPMDPPSTTTPPDQPPTLVYESFPKLQVVPFHYDNPVTGKSAAPVASFVMAAPGGAAPLAIWKQLNQLGDRITRLQDLTDVEIVQDAYGYYVDKAQWTLLADLFDDDATLEIGGKGVFLGKKRVFEYMSVGMGPAGPRNGLLIDHQQFQCLPTILEDGVTAKVRCIAFVMSSGGWGHNYYEDTFVKEDGVWKFKKLHGPFNMYSGYKLGWLDKVTVNTFPEKFEPWPDLPPTVIYLTYPNYYVEPYHYPNPVTGKPMPAPSPRAGGEAFGR